MTFHGNAVVAVPHFFPDDGGADGIGFIGGENKDEAVVPAAIGIGDGALELEEIAHERAVGGGDDLDAVSGGIVNEDEIVVGAGDRVGADTVGDEILFPDAVAGEPPPVVKGAGAAMERHSKKVLGP